MTFIAAGVFLGHFDLSGAGGLLGLAKLRAGGLPDLRSATAPGLAAAKDDHDIAADADRPGG